MKDYLKMATRFSGSVTIDYNGNICDDKSFFGSTDIAEDYYEPICHAINSHDELVRANKELLIHLERCAKELTSMINRHNKQSMEDGSWLYDQQTPYEAMWLIDRLNGIKPPAKDTINCDLYVAGGEA